MDPKVNILLVDDYPANLVALSAVLTDPLYHLIEATSGEQALQLIEETEVALVLLDIQMPGMDGYEVARQIRKNPKTRDVPIIFITAVYREEPSVRLGYEAGGQDYLGKPFDPEVLKAKVGIYSNLFRKTTILERQTRELIASEERYRLIVEGAQEIIATVDVSGVITSLNYAFERLTGLSAKDWVGKSFVPLIDEKDLPEVLLHFGESARHNSALLSTTHIHTGDEKMIPVEISVQPLVRDGRTLGTIGVMRDISLRVAPKVL
ncbi:MAG: response regulator [Methylotenera sp.]|nr:response regulator [Oligoflexia bacterium]